MATYDWGGGTSASSGQVNINPVTGQQYTPREMIGSTIGNIGTTLRLPEGGISEWIAPTAWAAETNPIKQQTKSLPINAPTLGPVNQVGGTGGGGGGGGVGGGSQQPQGDTSTDALVQALVTKGGYNLQDAINAAKSGRAGDLAREFLGQSGGEYDALRSEISSGWDNYINSLNSQLEGLGGQKSAQEGIVESQYQQGLNTLGLQRNQGLESLGTERTKLEKNQQKTLRDLSSNLKNAFMAGNVYLGARGAGDSSAANQYSLALTKEGTRQRSDVMAQISDQMQEINQRETNLNNIYNTEVNNLEQTKNQKVMEISQWFQNAQNQIRQMQAQGQLSKSQDLQSLSKDILNQAISAMNNINTEVSNRRSALESWAISNASNINQLKTNLQNVAQFSASMPMATQIAGTPQVDSTGNIRVQTGYGSSNEEKRRLLGY